jgi:hypothetical protein
MRFLNVSVLFLGMRTGIKRRISFPNKLAGEPGISLLFATWLKKQSDRYPLQYFLKKKQEFRGLELICADEDCKEPKSLANYGCTADFEGGKCDVRPLKLQADVIEEDGIEKIVPSTLRIWCPRGHHLYGKRFGARCEKDGGRLKYFLVGNEKDEFLLYSILELSHGLGYKTTTYYQAYLSCGGNVRKALNWLAEKGYFEKKEIDLVYRKWINEPDAYKITEKGLEKYNELKQTLSTWLYREFGRLLYARGSYFWKVEEPLEQKVKRYDTLIQQLSVSDLPQEMSDQICAEFTFDNVFYKRLEKAIKNKALPEDKRERFRVLRNQQISEECKLELVEEFGMKFRGIKKALAIKLRHDLEENTQTVFPLLEKLYNNPGHIAIERNGCIYRFSIPHLIKEEDSTLITHVPSGYLPQIYEADAKYADWSLADKL